MGNNKSGRQSEVDRLWDYLPTVFDLVTLPPDWDDEWIFIPLDSPESTVFQNSPDEELFSAVNDSIEQNISGINPIESLPEQVAGEFPGALHKTWTSPYPPADAFAFYLPFHYFYPKWWGIYLLAEGVEKLGEILHRIAAGRLTTTDCRIAARIFLFGHEQYHHSVESFATRLEITHRLPAYKTGFEDFYQRTRNTTDWLEEALANANGFCRVRHAYKKERAKRQLLDETLEEYIKKSPPGYNRGMEYVTNERFKEGEGVLAEAGHGGSSLHTPEADRALWSAFAHAFHPLRKRGSHVVYLAHKDSPLSRRVALAARYLRYRDVVTRLKYFGCSFVREGKGSHEIWRGPNQRTFSVPRHPGDFKKGTLSGILGQAGIQLGVKEFFQTGNATVLS